MECGRHPRHDPQGPRRRSRVVGRNPYRSSDAPDDGDGEGDRLATGLNPFAADQLTTIGLQHGIRGSAAVRYRQHTNVAGGVSVLTIWGPNQNGFCDAVTRRSFLKI